MQKILSVSNPEHKRLIDPECNEILRQIRTNSVASSSGGGGGDAAERGNEKESGDAVVWAVKRAMSKRKACGEDGEGQARDVVAALLGGSRYLSAIHELACDLTADGEVVWTETPKKKATSESATQPDTG